jgi:hypothetical protein
MVERDENGDSFGISRDSDFDSLYEEMMAFCAEIA